MKLLSEEQRLAGDKNFSTACKDSLTTIQDAEQNFRKAFSSLPKSRKENMKRTVDQFIIDYESKHGRRLNPAKVIRWIKAGHLKAFKINDHHYEIHGGLNVNPKPLKRGPKPKGQR